MAVLAAVALLVNAGEPLSLEPPAAGKVAPPAIQVADTGLKVVFVGLDGADWRVLQPMMEKGELPTFAAMMRQGASGDLATLHDSNSAVIWASIYTGVTPDRHGVDDFYRISLPGMKTGLYPVHRTYLQGTGRPDRAAGPLAAGAGGPLLPEDACPSGRSWTAPASPRAWWTATSTRSRPCAVPARRASSSPTASTATAQEPRPAPRTPSCSSSRQLFREVRPLLTGGDFYWQSAALFDLLAKRPQPRFLNFYTHEPDSAQHLYWKWWQPQHFFGVDREGAAGERRSASPRSTATSTPSSASLRRQVGPETVIIVASDHGHGPTILHRTSIPSTGTARRASC